MYESLVQSTVTAPIQDMISDVINKDSGKPDEGQPRPLVLSLKPCYATAILDGTKTVELRRQRIAAPCGTTIILYSSAPVMAVVGTATLAGSDTDTASRIWQRYGYGLSLSRKEYDSYLIGASSATVLLIGDPTPLDDPHPLKFLREQTGFRPPQSYRYLHANDPEVLHFMASRIPA
ncbi:hypothetical protein ACIRRA_43330 [Nocardia sp. NPDC101769]|uniref:hypothetical protein n=1 Tax=Nocardia sp. NPDC101769 TaxID=3364333 RepID=UPI00382EF4D1